MVSQVGLDEFKKLLTQTLPDPRFKMDFQSINPQNPIHRVGLGWWIGCILHFFYFFFER